jgi:hypothetical protein
MATAPSSTPGSSWIALSTICAVLLLVAAGVHALPPDGSRVLALDTSQGEALASARSPNAAGRRAQHGDGVKRFADVCDPLEGRFQGHVGESQDRNDTRTRREI